MASTTPSPSLMASKPSESKRPSISMQERVQQLEEQNLRLQLGLPAEDAFEHLDTEDDHPEASSGELRVTYSRRDAVRLAQEVYDQTIAEVNLTLFGGWIRQSDNNYQVAKSLIRELGLDQGYNVERIANEPLRRLLKKIHAVRPKCVSKSDSSQRFTLADPLSFSRRPTRTSVFLDRAAAESLRLSNLGGLKRSLTDRKTPRDLPYAASFRAEAMRRTPGGSLGAKKREEVPRVPSAMRAYPPDTPDRPAPLAFRSRSSGAPSPAIVTPTPLRAVSTPAPGAPSGRLALLPPPRRPARSTTTAITTMAAPVVARPASPPARIFVQTDDSAGADDVFGIRSTPHREMVPVARRVVSSPTTLASPPSEQPSSASLLAAFPVPPMANPVGLLPMAVSRPASSSSAASLRAVLQRTRGLGATLPLVSRESLSVFERSWRQANGGLLAAVFGPRGVVLRDEDVEFLDAVAGTLRVGGEEVEWVREILEEE
ncbi:hypothetical protein IQ07DRAFT_629267 [Pyrenochaeta sp. DS3sAY3a]|nr:hypothetical protein IQ07DRAFT_629267 [Pyrenochaeta sp. DS3sAY3a]